MRSATLEIHRCGLCDEPLGMSTLNLQDVWRRYCPPPPKRLLWGDEPDRYTTPCQLKHLRGALRSSRYWHSTRY